MMLDWFLAAVLVPCLVVQSAPTSVPKVVADCSFDLWHPYTCRGDPSAQHTGISEALLQDFQLMSEYAAAAYCPGNLDTPGTQVTCSACNCPKVEAANASTMLEFTRGTPADDSGFVAVDDKNRLIVVAFRGSLSISNWKVDLQVWMTSIRWCEGCKAHTGFWQAWQEIREKIIPLIGRARSEHPDYRVIVTGHSLGAAIATLAATELRGMDPHYAKITELYAYGSPRVGNRNLAIYMTSLSSLSYRFTSLDDSIPRSPVAWLGYRHISPEYWITREPDNPRADQIEVLEGYYNPNGNSGTTWLHLSAHRHYFGPIVDCGPWQLTKRTESSGGRSKCGTRVQ